MSKNKILIIDDDLDICALLKRFLERKDFEVSTAFKGVDGLNTLKEGDFSLVLCDFRLPDKDGVEMIQEIRKMDQHIPIVIITGYSDVKVAVKAIRLGAFEYVTKPIFPEEILLTINNALEAAAGKSERVDEESSSKSVSEPKAVPLKKNAVATEQEIKVGKSAQAKQVQQLMDLVAPTDMSVVILGESGTGKEVAARTIHNRSPRKNNRFVAVDCGALPKELAGSELFGHVKGSFTGAINDKKGHFEYANGGTLFLDEIGNLSYENQVKLLRVLQERKIRKVGSEVDQEVDVRIIVATNEDLKDAMRSGEFREDIYYRVNEFKIELPTLKDNKTDLKEYLDFFLEKANKELGKNIEGFTTEVIDAFVAYHWPGNIRELKNVIKRAVLLTQGSLIESIVLPPEILNPNFFAGTSTEDDDDRITDLKTVVEKAETKAILKVLEKTAFNKSRCAEILGIDRKTLYNKMNAYGLM